MNGLRWAFKGTPRWIVGSEKLIRRIVDSVDRQTNDSMVGLLGRVCVPAPVTDSIVGALRRGNLCPPGKSDLLRAGAASQHKPAVRRLRRKGRAWGTGCVAISILFDID